MNNVEAPSRSTLLLRASNPGRQISDTGWQEIETQAVEAIKTVQNLYNSAQIEFNEHQIDLQFQFEQLMQFYNKLIDTHRKFEETRNFDLWSYYRNERGDILIECRVTGPASNSINVSSIIQYILYEIFLVVNIAVPETFNLAN